MYIERNTTDVEEVYESSEHRISSSSSSSPLVLFRIQLWKRCWLVGWLVLRPGRCCPSPRPHLASGVAVYIAVIARACQSAAVSL